MGMAMAGNSGLLTSEVCDYRLMTMVKKLRYLPAGQFKAKCLAILDQVALTGEEIVVTKRGKPVAKVVPIEPAKPTSLIGSVLREEDIVTPIGEEWHADR